MNRLRNLAGFTLTFCFLTTLSAQNTDCTFKKSFRSSDGIYMQISNKFGDISLLKSDNDSISVCATVSIKQDDIELSKKSIGLIRVEIDKSADTIRVKTIYDEKFFSSTFRKGRTGFSVDYVVNLPASSNIKISNSFGDVTMDEFDGIVNVRISNGNLSAEKLSRGNIKPVSYVSVENGKAVIEDANWLSLSAKHCQSVVIEKARALLLSTEFSKLTLGDINSIVSDSRSDNYEINSVRNFVGVSTLTEFRVELLSGQLQSRTAFGSLSVNEVGKDFSAIDISGSKTPVYLGFRKGLSYKVDLALINCLLDFPFEENNMVNKATAGNTTHVTGIAGNNKDAKALLKIKLDLGKLEIR